jgi:MFS family permease
LRQIALAIRAPASAEGRNIRNVLIDGIGVGLASAASPFLPVFLVRLGASDLMVGLLTAMPALTGMLLAIPIGRFLDRQRQIVSWYSVARLAVISSYALTGLVPLLFPAREPQAIIGIWALATVPQTVVGVVFTVIMGTVAGPRGRFYLMSRRWTLLGGTTAVTVALAGQILDWLPYPQNYQFVFLGLSLGGLISYYFSSHIVLPDNPPRPTVQRAPLNHRMQGWVRSVWQQQDFVRFSFSQFIFRAGLTLAQPLFPIYWVRQLDASDGWIGLINTVQGGVLLVAYFVWVRLSRRRGERFVLLATTLGVSFYPLLVALTRRVEPMALYAGLAGIFQAGVDLVFFDILLASAPEAQRQTYVALYQTTVYLATLIGPLLGTTLSDQIGIVPALILGSVLRLAGFGLFAGLGTGRKVVAEAA